MALAHLFTRVGGILTYEEIRLLMSCPFNEEPEDENKCVLSSALRFKFIPPEKVCPDGRFYPPETRNILVHIYLQDSKSGQKPDMVNPNSQTFNEGIE